MKRKVRQSKIGEERMSKGEQRGTAGGEASGERPSANAKRRSPERKCHADLMEGKLTGSGQGQISSCSISVAAPHPRTATEPAIMKELEG